MVDVGAETGTAALEQKLQVTVRSADPARYGKLREAFGALKKPKMETSEETENK